MTTPSRPDPHAAERLRRLAIVVRAEREIAAATRAQYAILLAAIARDVLEGKAPVVAAQDAYDRGELSGAALRRETGFDGNDAAITAAVPPSTPPVPDQNRNQIAALWLLLGATVTAAILAVFVRRFLGTGAPKDRLANASRVFLAGMTQRLKGVPDEVYADLNRITDQALRSGLSAPQIRELLAAELTPGHPEYEARLDDVSTRVARTSAIAAFNAGDQEGQVALAAHNKAAPPTKRWLSSHDDRVRPTHVVADNDPANQAVAADGWFTVGGFQALYPGDWTLPASEAANCRCTAIYSTGDIVPDAITAAVTQTPLPNGFRGPIAALDVPTGDKRQLNTPAGGIKTREFPLSLTMNHVGDPTGYPVIGHLDRVWAQDGLLHGEGAFDLGGEAGREAARHLHEGHMNTVSIDPDMVVAAIHTYDADGTLISSDQLSAEATEQFRLAGTPFAAPADDTSEDTAEPADQTSHILAFTDWRLAGLAMVPIPAYTQARIEPVYDYVRLDAQPGDALVAAVGGQVFNKSFFADPKLTAATPLTITEDGHVFGHVREHGTCYQYGGGKGDGGFCLEPPDSACGYAKFEVHGARMDDGSIMRCGALTFGDGHSSRGSLAASAKHYNDVASIAAKGVVGTDVFGVWFSGEVVDGYAERAYDLLLSPLSGHWEPDADNGGHLEMIAIHIVVTPGYTVRRIVAGFDDSGMPNSLIITTPAPATVPVLASPAAVPSGRALLAAALADQRRADRLAKRIGVDRAARTARALARIKAPM